MNPEEAFEQICAHARNQLVTDRQLAANSLSVWIATRKEEATGYTIWFEPSWHVVGPKGVVAGSRQAQDDEEPTGWQAVSDAIDTLVGRTVEDLHRDLVTGDLELVLSDGLRVRSFVTDPRDGFLWRVRDLATGLRINGSPGKITVQEAA
jgi:hypothetical protein